ncbi:phospholipase A1-like isoform X2 [Prorops nasuta]|uniref:phospholipase A1-like isoform X2 n=1 Tax=Prorops nasuta TaxID=863751 RepID=UPI0034D01144
MRSLKFPLIFLFFIYAFRCGAQASAEDSNSEKSPDVTISNVLNETIKGVSDVIDDVVPDCIFGVDHISFIVFTRNNTAGEDITLEEDNVPLIIGKIVFLIHGFTSEANNSQYYLLAQAWLEKEDITIISVQWKDAACSANLTITELMAYPSAVINTREVGKYVANLTHRLVHDYNISLNEIMIVGHSLGAQVAGFAGKHIQTLEVGKYFQILGLDPAGPLFSTFGCNNRLCISDANFVNIFHTSLFAGTYRPLGHIDNYFAHGYAQPGCDASVSCSHGRPITYLTEIIKDPSCKFLGQQWNMITGYTTPIKDCTETTCEYAGPMAAYSPARGTFYVNVNSTSAPFCTKSY